MPRRALSVAVAVAGIAAAVALVVVGEKRVSVPPGLAALVNDLDGAVREAAAGLHARASTLAELPRLGNAVATDAATVHDLTEEELAFRPKPDETIEIGQVRHDGKAVSLLEIPAGATLHAQLDHAGVTVASADDALVLTEVVDIKAAAGGEADHGALAVSWKLDVRARLAALGVPATLSLRDRVLASTQAPIPAGADLAIMFLPGGVGGGLLSVTAQAKREGLPFQLAGGGVALLTLLGAVFLWRRGSTPLERATTTVSGSPPLVENANTSPRAGTATFGRYTVQRKLGAGGMAEVYLATAAGEAGFAKTVALKIMHRHLAAVPQIVEHFLDEARLASRLSHPNIVQIIDLGRAGDDYYIAMEHLDGYDLGYLMASGRRRGVPVPLDVALAVLAKVCRGLHAAHTAVGSEGAPLDLVHRDVKAENVLLSRQGDVKVSDFGIAKANERQAKTQAGQVKGTTAYMAPEHRLGQPVDRRADIYGVGALAYELLTGTEINLDFELLAHRGVAGWPHLALPSALRPGLPVELDGVVMRALAFDKESRYATCAELADTIDEIAARHGLAGTDKHLIAWVNDEAAVLDAGSAANAV